MTHADLINLWPSLSDFAEDIGVSYETAKAMRRRSSVPGRYWKTMVDRAAERTLDGVSLEALAEGAAPKMEAAE